MVPSDLFDKAPSVSFRLNSTRSAAIPREDAFPSSDSQRGLAISSLVKGLGLTREEGELYVDLAVRLQEVPVGGLPIGELASEFKVSEATIRDVVRKGRALDQLTIDGSQVKLVESSKMLSKWGLQQQIAQKSLSS